MTIQARVGSWEPDKADLEKSGATEALNVIPTVDAYRLFPGYGSVSTALTARCQGSFFARKSDGSGVVIAGDATKLYLQSTSTFTNVSRLAGGPYTTPSDGRWSFVQFGSNVQAYNGTDVPQVFNLDSSSNFTALGGSAPTALYACVVGDFVFTGNQAIARNRVQWSAINNGADFVTSQATEADQQDFPDGGAVQAVLGYSYQTICLQEFGIKIGSYEGPQLIFRFSKISDGVGCSIPGSAAAFRDLCFFVSHSGVYMLQGATSLTPIGEQRVNRWLRDNINQTFLFRCCAGIDPINNQYVLGFPDNNSSDGTINHFLTYNWAVDRFAHVQAGNFEWLYSGVTQTGWTIEQLASTFGTIENVPFPFDSVVWTGQAQPLLAAFGTDHKLGYFNAASLAGTVTTSESNLISGKRAFVRSLRPLVSGSSITGISVALGTRDRQSDAVTYGSAVAQNAYGACKFRSVGRYHRGQMQLAAACSADTLIQGLTDINAQPFGTR